MDITFTSVTTYIDYFFEKFDAEKVAKKLVAKYPKYENRTVESLLEEWDKSAKYGTIVHDEIENWIFWIGGDIISIPLYLYKGLVLTSFQYLVFTLIAIAGYFSWKKKILYVKK